MKKLNKSETALLALVNENGTYLLRSSHGKGPFGGEVSKGQRHLEAANSLIFRGLVEEVSRYNYQETYGEGTIFFCEVTLSKIAETS